MIEKIHPSGLLLSLMSTSFSSISFMGSLVFSMFSVYHFCLKLDELYKASHPHLNVPFILVNLSDKNHHFWMGKKYSFVPGKRLLLLMEEIPNNHLGCIKPYNYIMGFLAYQLVQDFSHQ